MLHFPVAVVDLVYRFFRLDLGMVIDSALQVFIKDQATVSEIVHVDSQDHVTVTGERGRITDAIVRSLAEGRERRMLVLCFDDVLLTPVVEAAVVVQRDDRRGGQLRALGDQEVAGHGDIRCGVEGQSLADVVPFIDALENLRVGLARGRPIGERVKDFLAALRFPCLKIFGAAVEKRQALACTLLFLFYEGIEVAQSRAFPTLVLIGGDPAGLHRGHGAGCGV